MQARSEDVSPTAYATGELWVRHGLSHPALLTAQGRRLGRWFRGLGWLTKRLSGVSLEAMLLARHRGIDAVLTRAIEAGEVSQVIEIAAGLSPRGWRFAQRHGARLTWLDSDLPAMARTKRELLARGGLASPQHRVVELDALADEGPASLAAVAATLDPNRGLAIVTEGLMNYLDPDSAQATWRRIARTLAGFPHGLYLADVYFREQNRSAGLAVFGAALSAFVRGRMHLHYATPEAMLAGMRAAGFARATIHRTADLPETRALAAIRGGDHVRVLEARSAARPQSSGA